MGGEHLAQPRPPGRQVPGEARMVLREAGLAAEGLLPDGAAEPLRERDERGPALGAVGAGADDDRGRLGAASRSASASTASGSAPAERSSRSRARAISCGSGPGALQSSIGTITIAGPRPVAASW